MKSVVVGIVVTVLGMLVACGPSAAEIKMAKSAGYKGDPGELFDVIEQTTAQTYKIGEANRIQHALMTVPQWYNPEGGRQSAGAGDYVQVVDRSVQLALVVQLVDMENRFVVEITPKAFQHIAGSPQPRELQPDDPNLPGWVTGRVETLQLEIHKSLQKYVVQ